MESFLFAGLMLIDLILFIVLAKYYTYVKRSPEERQQLAVACSIRR